MNAKASAVQQDVTETRDIARLIVLALIVVGLVVSGYLSYSKLSGGEVQCIEGSAFDCGMVESSDYAEFMGIPVAYLGLVSYLVIGALVLFEDQGALMQEYSRLLVFLLVFVGWLYSMWLVYVQVAILEALCPWCLTHELTMTIMLGVVGYRFWKNL